MPVPSVKSIIMPWKITRQVTSQARFELLHKMSERLSRKQVREVTMKSGVTLSDIIQLAAEAGTRVLKLLGLFSNQTYTARLQEGNYTSSKITCKPVWSLLSSIP